MDGVLMQCKSEVKWHEQCSLLDRESAAGWDCPSPSQDGGGGQGTRDGLVRSSARPLVVWGRFEAQVRRHEAETGQADEPGFHLRLVGGSGEGDEKLLAIKETSWDRYWARSGDINGIPPLTTLNMCVTRHRKYAPLSAAQALRVVEDMALRGVDAVTPRRDNASKNAAKRRLREILEAEGGAPRSPGLLLREDVIEALHGMRDSTHGGTRLAVLALFTNRGHPRSGDFLVNPFPPADPNGLHPVGAWNIMANKAIVSVLIRARKPVTTLVALPLRPSTTKSFRNPAEPESFDRYVGFLDIVLDNARPPPAVEAAFAGALESCGNVADRFWPGPGAERLWRKRVYLFKQGTYYVPRDKRGYPVEFGDALERRSIFYHELVQLMYELDHNGALHLYASPTERQLIVANHAALPADGYELGTFVVQPSRHFRWLFDPRAEDGSPLGETWLVHGPTPPGAGGPRVHGEHECLRVRQGPAAGVWVRARLVWNETTADVGLSFRGGRTGPPMEPLDRQAFETRYALHEIQTEIARRAEALRQGRGALLLLGGGR
eukprot:CAMPEP_0177620090 /NCGR_PEP_ID=MMETSP0419_2-20121207/26674_1 /TAXON_ID=582737 /ORGANISM="Tetraselmis sp., Strain GSL018" /LENGTH=548 /DNA_ID=CAMNT_0019119533 /DNA_START=156 /DNA_END=1802 /DNA_ORIENTATION=+